ncbi:MAG: GTPase [Kiritimatiellia bacterium]
MPANLTPEYRKAEQEYKAASTPEEKLGGLKRMLAVIPKHKGTDKMQGDLKRRIAQLKDQLSTRRKKKGPSFRIRPEGAGQVTLIGPPNSGKSSLLKSLTRAEPEVAPYPCTTHEPAPGMAVYKDVQIQLVDLPPVWRGECESFVFDNIRGSDAALIVIDLNVDPVTDFQDTIRILDEKHLPVTPAVPQRRDDPPHREKVEYMLVLNKGDLDPRGEMLPLIREMNCDLPCHRVVSAKNGMGTEDLKEDIFRLLHVIRVFSKQPGKAADLSAPFAVPAGCTVLEFAEHVHQDFANGFKSARVWGSAKFDGQAVHRDHVLREGDIVELNM